MSNAFDEFFRAEKRLTDRLKPVGVQVFDFGRGSLVCEECGRIWWCGYSSGGRRNRGFWKCPQGCNHHLKPR